MITTELRRTNNVPVIYVAGALDLESRGELIALLDGILAGSDNKLVLNLRAIEYISSSGVGTILNTAGELRKKGGILVIAEASSVCLHVLRLLRLDDFFKHFPEESVAIEWLRGLP